jgi:hypothetical protein
MSSCVVFIFFIFTFIAVLFNSAPYVCVKFYMPAERFRGKIACERFPHNKEIAVAVALAM